MPQAAFANHATVTIRCLSIHQDALPWQIGGKSGPRKSSPWNICQVNAGRWFGRLSELRCRRDPWQLHGLIINRTTLAALFAIAFAVGAPSVDLPKLVAVRGKVLRWTTPNTVIVAYTETALVDVPVGTVDTTTPSFDSLSRVGIGVPPGVSVSVPHHYEKRRQTVTRNVTVTNLSAGMVRAGQTVAFRCYPLAVTARGMDASYAFDSPETASTPAVRGLTDASRQPVAR